MRIGDLAKQAGCTAETVRYYEREGLLPEPERSGNNYRLYDRSHLEALRFIRNCRALEMNLDEIKALVRLKNHPGEDCSEVNALLEEHIAHVSDRIARLECLRENLTQLRGRCDRVLPIQECAILQELNEPQQGDTACAGRASHIHGARCAREKETRAHVAANSAGDEGQTNLV